ncbi:MULTISPECIES: RpiB/LacA/LacB family sugar-phosphate isomerase [unclassified Pseudonocardia]|uniref:RpiB/LacA/LacB family sugar-phosphate isomerase n=1 Tax=unclassified Pseudonocardia TaxID=2619320 RepID=UPI0001FFEFA8|nr:RpiB/LacA/LacB family sugar-phosphate isomerase [Pseudonocardia sp. Ae707_Ps1]OLM18280.1 Ribose 5-phosphate isomerase B [Pseudonocardia sp. Ae707_Ps1]
MKVSLGADHAGFPLKQFVREAVERLGHEVLDQGTHSEEPVDFPDITAATCRPVLDGTADRAILVCGSGAGAIMAANKIDGIRCALAHEPYSAHQAVEHDDANAIAMGSWLVPRALVPEIVERFLHAAFDDTEETRRRVAKLHALEGGDPAAPGRI